VLSFIVGLFKLEKAHRENQAKMTISFPYRNVAVTGGAGFVGSSLALALKRDFPSAQVKVLDNLKRRGSELNR